MKTHINIKALKLALERLANIPGEHSADIASSCVTLTAWENLQVRRSSSIASVESSVSGEELTVKKTGSASVGYLALYRLIGGLRGSDCTIEAALGKLRIESDTTTATLALVDIEPSVSAEPDGPTVQMSVQQYRDTIMRARRWASEDSKHKPGVAGVGMRDIGGTAWIIGTDGRQGHFFRNPAGKGLETLLPCEAIDCFSAAIKGLSPEAAVRLVIGENSAELLADGVRAVCALSGVRMPDVGAVFSSCLEGKMQAHRLELIEALQSCGRVADEVNLVAVTFGTFDGNVVADDGNGVRIETIFACLSPNVLTIRLPSGKFIEALELAGEDESGFCTIHFDERVVMFREESHTTFVCLSKQ